MRVRIALLVAAACALAPSAAPASQLYLVGYPGSYHVNYVAAPGERNVVSASALLGHIVNVYDDGAAITTLSKPDHDGVLPGYTRYPCDVIDAHHGRCIIPALLYGATDLTAELESVTVKLGDGDDTYSTIENTDPFAPIVDGGPGDDGLWLLGKPIFLSADAGDGANYIRAAATTDSSGLPYTNSLAGGDGPDEIYALNGTRNSIVCLGGVDHVVADNIDSVDASCENVERR